MSNASARSDSGLLIRWIVFSALGLGAGILFGLGVSDPVEALVGMMLVTPVVLTAAGSVFAGSQWLALGHWHRIGFAWIGASGCTLGIGMTLGIVIVEVVGQWITGAPMRLFAGSVVERTVSLLVIGAFTGLAVGVSQWFVVRRYLQGSGWIVLTTLAFTIGFPGGALAADFLPGGLRSLMGFALFVCLTGLIVGMITSRSVRSIAIGLAATET